jgi:hypothetical protein
MLASTYKWWQQQQQLNSKSKTPPYPDGLKNYSWTIFCRRNFKKSTDAQNLTSLPGTNNLKMCRICLVFHKIPPEIAKWGNTRRIETHSGSTGQDTAWFILQHKDLCVASFVSLLMHLDMHKATQRQWLPRRHIGQ